MNSYQHIIIGLDLSDESFTVLQKAKLIAHSFDAQVTLVHVVEPITFSYGGDVPIDLTETQNKIIEQAEKRLDSISKEAELTDVQKIVSIGQAASELHALAEQHEADLIVVGSHGRHGLALLLGSTANGVLHGAKCDVLAIRV